MRSSNKLMKDHDVAPAVAAGKLYFGHAMAARQGAPRRHAYMQAAVKLLAQEGVEHPKIVEIGSWAGGSAITWGRAIQKYASGGWILCVDHWQPYFDLSRNSEDVYRLMDAAARSGDILELFRHNITVAGLEKMVLPIRGLAKDVLPLLPQDWFDLAFIDGSHAYKDVVRDIQQSCRLVRQGGIVCGDDLELELGACPPEYTKRMSDEDRDYVPHPNSGVSYHPGVTLAVAEIFGEVSCWEGFWAMRRGGEAWMKFSLPEPEAGCPDHLG